MGFAALSLSYRFLPIQDVKEFARDFAFSRRGLRPRDEPLRPKRGREECRAPDAPPPKPCTVWRITRTGPLIRPTEIGYGCARCQAPFRKPSPVMSPGFVSLAKV